MDVREALLAGGLGARLPGFGDPFELPAGKVGEGADVTRRVDDDLLAPDRRAAGEEALATVGVARPGPEGGELVRDDAYLPPRRVGCPARRSDRKRLGRRGRLPALAKGAARDIVLGLARSAAGRRAAVHARAR